MLVPLDASRGNSLTERITNGIRDLIDSRVLLPGERLPSIRRFARQHRVSVFTVIQAHDRLTATGHLEPRQGAGFFVCTHAHKAVRNEPHPEPEKAVADLPWLMHRQYREFQFLHLPGSEWLPPQWLEDNGPDRAMRCLSRWDDRRFLSGYGDPKGSVPLRSNVGRRLANLGIEADPDQILLTDGIAGAIDLAGRCLLATGDVALVDDPGCARKFEHLQTLGARIHGIPWRSSGPDLDRLESIASQMKPRLHVTTPIVHSPTGYSSSRGNAFRLLQIAERYDFLILEDDADGVCHPSSPPRLASLDQLNRVVYANGFSRSLAPRLRVGFLAANRKLVRDLSRVKALSRGATSELTEQLVHEVLPHGHYRKHRATLLDRLQRARISAVRRLEAIGFGPIADDAFGLFAWMDVPGMADSMLLAEAADQRGMLLAPRIHVQPGGGPVSEDAI